MKAAGQRAPVGRSDRSLFERRVTVHQLRIFKTAADVRSFSRAAEQLHLSQPAVSHQVKALSAAIGAPLFEELGRRIQPTETGRLLYEHASLILSEFEAAGRAIDEHHGLKRGLLRLVGDTTVGIYVLPDVLGAFRQAHPDIALRLDIGNRRHVYERLLTNEADFAVLGRNVYGFPVAMSTLCESPHSRPTPLGSGGRCDHTRPARGRL